MKPYLTAAIAGLATMTFATGAQAADKAGTFQIKGMITQVNPDGGVEEVEFAAQPLPANSDTRASTNVVPTLAGEWFLSENISVETICCLTSHHITGTGGINNAQIADSITILPATLTLKARTDLGGIEPYIGAGPSLFMYFGEEPGQAMTQLYGADKLKLKNSFGFAVQAGVDIPINEQMGVSVDAKRYWQSTTAKFYDGSTQVFRSKHKLDPWVIGGGLYYRF